MDLTRAFAARVRRVLGLPDSELPQLDLLARYEATIVEQSSDGKLVKVRFESRPSMPELQCELRPPFPGAVVTVTTGAKVLIGWMGGDPKGAFAEPCWGQATCTELVINVTGKCYIGSKDAAQALVTKHDHDIHSHTITGVANLTTGDVSGSTAAPAAPATGTQVLMGA